MGVATSDQVNDGDQGALAMSLKRELKVLTNAHSYLQATHSSPNDGTVTYLGVNSLTCTGWPFTVDSSTCAIRSIGVTDVNNVMTVWENGVNCSIYSTANVIYILNLAGASFTAFLATDLSYKVAIAYQQKAYDPTVDVIKQVEQSPDRMAFVQDSLVDAVNVAAATAYYPSSTGMSMDGFRHLSLSGYIIQGDAITDTIELQFTNDEDPTDATAWVTGFFWNPYTNAMVNIITTGGVAGTYPFLADYEKCNFSYFRVKLVTGDSTNTINIKVRRSN
jgi:hypothetical protein